MQLAKKGKMFPSCKSKPAESRVWGFIELTLKNRLHSKASESFLSNFIPSSTFNSSWWSLLSSTIFIDFICSYFHGFKKGREIKNLSINPHRNLKFQGNSLPHGLDPWSPNQWGTEKHLRSPSAGFNQLTPASLLFQLDFFPSFVCFGSKKKTKNFF